MIWKEAAYSDLYGQTDFEEIQDYNSIKLNKPLLEKLVSALLEHRFS